MSIRWRLGLAAVLMLAAAGAGAEERRITVAASPELIESGLLKHMLPRFSLKTGIRTTPVPLEPGVEAEVLIGPAVDGGQPGVPRRGDGLSGRRRRGRETGAGGPLPRLARLGDRPAHGGVLRAGRERRSTNPPRGPRWK